MISLDIEYFDLRRICESGQIFRMYEREEGVFDVYSLDRHLRLRQSGNKVDFFCSREDFDGYWRRFFDLDRDYAAIVRAAAVPEAGSLEACEKQDGFLAEACRFGAGIRILHQDIWEMLISFIISQQKQIPSIRKCIEALCERFGEKKTESYATGDCEEGYRKKSDCEGGNSGDGSREGGSCEWYTFPTPEAIAAGGPEGLKGLSLGYRERYIYETSVKYLTDGLPCDKVESMGLDAAKTYFTSFCGVGEKVANCICLFGAGYVDAFPIDTHIKDILYREYYLKYDCAGRPDSTKGKPAARNKKDVLSQAEYEELVRKHFDRFSGYRGIVQQWIFAKEVFKDA